MAGPLFQPFRALGYITEDVPFAVQRRGKETYVTVSVGRTWQVRCAGATALLCRAVPSSLHTPCLLVPTHHFLRADLQHSKADTRHGGASGGCLLNSCDTRKHPSSLAAAGTEQSKLWGVHCACSW